MKKVLYLLILVLAAAACGKPKTEGKFIGTIERIDPGLDAIVSADAKAEVIGEGFDWSEGPVWLEGDKKLIFSDVPTNKIFQWTEEGGTSEYLTPSGYTGTVPRGGEMGSNGLTLNREGKLVLAQHGDRRIAMMTASTSSPAADFTSLADNYEGKKFNSPNDVVFRDNGDIFFTDPPYGLPNQENDTTKEIPFQGVFRASPDGHVTLVCDSITRPNGIAFLPGGKTLIVANSDPDKAIWYAFDISDNNEVTNPRIFMDATPNVKAGDRGVPDGFRVDKQGNIFATGPGGIWIMNSNGKVLGKIRMSEATSNCALSPDEKTLYITADMYIARVKLR